MKAASLYAPFVTTAENGENKIVLSVDGVHCPACIQKIESALVDASGVTQARLNYTTKRLTITWQGDAALADGFINTVNALGYKARPFEGKSALSADGAQEKFLKICMGVAGFASGNIMLLSFGLWITNAHEMGVVTRELFHLISALIALPTVVFSGRPFFISAYHVLKKGHTNMDVPISLAIILATGMSIFEMYQGGEHVFFDSVVMLIFFLLIGRYLDFLALSNARGAAGTLISMMARTAHVLHGERMQEMLIRDLREGMTVLVGVGEYIPADAHILEGVSNIDMSPVTGEAVPVTVHHGDAVFSGTMNMTAPLKITIARAADNSLLADIIRMMEKAEQGQAKYVRIADRAAKLYTPVVHFLALITFAGWIISGASWQPALMTAITVLIITCPCALGLAVPVVQMLGVGGLMKRGIMVKAGDALERLSAIDIVMLDKTGALTQGRPALVKSNDHIKLAASLAKNSRHPLSMAITRAYDGDVFDLSVSEVTGAGLEASFEGKRVRLGSRTWCGDITAQDAPEALELWLAVEGQAPICFSFHDPLRADALEFVAALQAMGMQLVLASGDRKAAVENIAGKLGIAQWHAECKPNDKFELLEGLRAKGHKVLMMGDGMNDAPVLAGADVSVAPASGLDIARNAADIVFTGDLLAPILLTHRVAKMSQTLVKENFLLAVLYNVAAIPLAMAGYVTPFVAAIAMSSSSLIVIINAFRLRRAL